MKERENFLVLDNLSKFFGDVKAVQNVSINIKRGELVSFIGPSGCGKTTLLRMIGGFYEQDSGHISLDGYIIDNLPPEKRLTGMVFQNYALFPHMTVAENVAYGLQTKKVPKHIRDEKVKKSLQQVQLSGYDDRKPSELSGGQQQRVAIARCLVLEPKVLLLDEPLSNLDANLRMIMREEIRRLKDALDLTIIFVTHDQEEALSISDRIVVLNEGKVQQIGTPEEIYRRPANEFVANFVGYANILQGSIVHEEGENFFTSDSIKWGINSVNVGNGQANLTQAVIRPEQIEILESGGLTGEITRVIYNGNYIRYYVDIADQEIMVDSFNGKLYNEGDIIGLKLPSDIHFLQ